MGSGIAAAGAAGEIVGAGLRARAARQAAAARAGQDTFNATLAERAGADAVARGEVATEKSNLRTGAAVADGQQQYAASGVDTSSGSPVDVLGDMRMMGTLDAITTKNNAFREAMGYAMQGKNLRAKAKYDLDVGNQEATSAILGGFAGGARAALPLLRIGRPSDPVTSLNDWQPEDAGDYAGDGMEA